MSSRLYFAAALVLAGTLCAQQKNSFESPIHHQVDPLNSYHRVIAVVPYVGSGKASDPRRPKYAPTAPAKTAHSGIIAFTHIPSDDKTMAIVEFVSTDRASLLPILSDKTIVSFEKGLHAPLEILTAVQVFKKAFTLDHFGMAAR